MAVLTWRNVDAPSLAGAAQVVANNGQNIGGAFNDLAAGLGAFNQARTDRADAAAIQAASQITDSGQYAQALQDGSILRNAGIDPNMISGRAAQLLAGRQDTLLGNDFRQAQIENQRADNEMARDRFKAEQDQAVINNQRSDYRFSREKAANARADTLLANTELAKQLKYSIDQAGVDTAGARGMIYSANVPDEVKQMVLSSYKMGGGILPTVDAPPTTGGLRTGADAWWGSTGGNPVLVPDRPLSQGTFGEAHDFGQKLIPLTRGKVGAGPDKGTSAVGAYQFIGDTMETYAEKVFGKDWRNENFNFENQSKIAEALFNDKKDGNLKEIWAGLPDSRPGAYKDMSFEEFQRTVLPLESGITLDEARAVDAQNRVASVQAQTSIIDEGMLQNAAQNLGPIDLGQYNKDSANKDPDLSKAASKAIKANPALEGTDLNTVSGWLREIQDMAPNAKTRPTAAQATHILGAAMRPDTGVLDFADESAKSGFVFDEDLAKDLLTQVTSGGNIKRGIVQERIASDRKVLDDSSKALATAVKDMQTLREMDVNRERVDPGYRAKVVAAFNRALEKNERLNQKFSSEEYQQILTQSGDEIAVSEKAKLDQAAKPFTPVLGGPAAGIGYAPATAITTGLPNQAERLLRDRFSQ